jgi:hypothetical protein
MKVLLVTFFGVYSIACFGQSGHADSIRNAYNVFNERRDIEYFFDKIVLDYPHFHENYTGPFIKICSKKPDQAFKAF